MSKMSKKFMALLLIAVMTLGMSMTAFAAENNSPSGNEYTWKWSSEQEKLDYFAQCVYSNVSVPVGIGSIAKITDPAMKAKVSEQISNIWNKYDGKIKTRNNKYVWSAQALAFDVQGVKSGQVTLKLNDEGSFKVANYINHLVIVSHYNEATGQWEEMKKFAEIDSKGCITIEFSSYSPIVLNVLNITEAHLAADAGVAVYKTTYKPVATPVEKKPVISGSSGTEYVFTWENDQEKLDYFAQCVYSNVSVPVGIGSIAKITDSAMQAKVSEQISNIWNKYDGKIKTKDDKYVWSAETLAFDVQGVKSGQVTLKLNDEGSFKVANYINHLVIVSHYNEATGQWEEMPKFAEVDANGCITIEFSSYSPILLSITNITAADLAADSGIAVYKTTYEPAATPVKAAPKTSDNLAGLFATIAILGCAVVGVVATRRKMVR